MLEKLEDDPWWLRLLNGWLCWHPLQRQRGHETDAGFLKCRDVSDGAGEVILEHGFVIGVEKRECGLAVKAGDGEAEVEILVIHSLAVDAVEIGGVFGVGVGQGIDVVDP